MADASSKVIRRVSKFRATQQWLQYLKYGAPSYRRRRPSSTAKFLQLLVTILGRSASIRRTQPGLAAARLCAGPRTQSAVPAPPATFAASRSVELNSVDDVPAVLAREILFAFSGPGFTPWVFQTKVGGRSVRQAAGENTKLDKAWGQGHQPYSPRITSFFEAGPSVSAPSARHAGQPRCWTCSMRSRVANHSSA